MIPIRDTTVSKSLPVVTWTIMGLNGLVFLLQLSMPAGTLEGFIYQYGLVPAKFTVPSIAAWFSFPASLFTFVSYMFLHGSFMHFVGNMWFLYLFGDNVEDHLGAVRYIGFYLAGGLVAGACHFLLNPHSPMPTIGASGAIAAVMGGYFLRYPRARILTLIPIIIIPLFIEIPAFLFLGAWFVIQFFNAAGSGGGSGIAWWAHVGGFLAGMILIRFGPALPAPDLHPRLQTATRRKATPRLQVIPVTPVPGTPDLEGPLEITTVESLAGARKMVNIPWGFYKRMIRVTVPPGVKTGTRLRLAGLGRALDGNGRGDLYLVVKIHHGI